MSKSKSNILLSVDYDGTMATESIKNYTKQLVLQGFEVHIVTARFETVAQYSEEFIAKNRIVNIEREHQKLFEDADYCGISRDRIHFMNMRDKLEFFLENEGFLWHLDDDMFELRGINAYTDTVGISCANGSNWRHKCDRLIKKKLNEIQT